MPYRAPVIGLLRFVGLMNAAVWFGAAVLFSLGIAPATASPEMQQLLQKNFPYFSVAIAQILTARFFYLYLACSLVAVLHLLTDWIYFGKYPRRAWLWLILGLCLWGLVQSQWLQPRLKTVHQLSYTAARPEQRAAASQSYRAWHGTTTVLNVLAACGLGLYFWRIANPPDPARFVSATKFRS